MNKIPPKVKERPRKFRKIFSSKPFFVIAILRFLLYRIKLKLTKKWGKISKGSTLESEWISKYHYNLFSLYPI